MSLTPEDRHQLLRHFPTMLARWRGGNAFLYSYCMSLSGVLKLRVVRKGVHGNLEIACGGLQTIRASERWDDSNIEIDVRDNGSRIPDFVVRDEKGGLEIVCDGVDIAENVKPIWPD